MDWEFILTMITIRNCIAIGAMVCAISGAHAAETYLDLKAGYAASTWWGGSAVATNLGDTSYTLDLYGNRQMHSGLSLGASLELSLFSSLFFQPELLFTMKGFGLRQLRNDPLDSTLTTVTMNYLEAPLLIKWRFEDSDLLPCVYIGPTLGILLAAYGSMENPKQSFSSADNDYLTKYSSKFDCGAAIGASVEKRMGRNRIVIEARCTMGFIAINSLSQFQQSQGVSSDAFPNDKNLVVSIMAGYGFASPF